jgi:hypothetical protein
MGKRNISGGRSLPETPHFIEKILGIVAEKGQKV